MNTPPKSIAILGGGFTGLTAAYYLSKAGHSVTIFERSSELGGLASGFTIEGTNLEKAYHHLFRTDTDILEFLDELGIGEVMTWNKSSMALYHGDTLYPFMTPLDLLRFRPLPFLDRIRAGVVVLYLQKTKRWKKFVGVTALSWMKRWAGKKVVEVIWQPLLLGKFNTYYDKVSMAWLWARVHVRANSRGKDVSKELLGYPHGGFAVIVEALTKKLIEQGVAIQTGVSVQEIASIGGRPHMSYATPAGKVAQQTFDDIIVTTPSSTFSKLIEKSASAEYVAQLRSVEYLGAVCLIFSSTQSVSPYYWHNINNTEFPFLVFIEHTRLIDPAQYGGKSVYYIGSYVPNDHRYFTMTDVEIQDLWFTYVKKIFPAFDQSLVKETHVFKFKNAQHIVGTDYEQKIPAYETPLPGVYLANFSQIFPEDRGTNFAVREGKRVAERILTKNTPVI